MKYPYIGKGLESGSIAMIYDKEKGVTMESKSWACEDGEHHDNIDENYFKNITREYLTNTYGKVESKEHADFIVKLAKVNGFGVIEDYKSGVMWFNCDRDTLDFYRDKETASNDGEKLITIPMPPKEENQKVDLNEIQVQVINNTDNLVQISKNQDKGIIQVCVNEAPKEPSPTATKDIDANITITDVTPTVNDCVVDRDFYPTPLNNGDNLMFAGEPKELESKEWPQVGDLVVTVECRANKEDLIKAGVKGVILTDEFKGDFCVKLSTGLEVMDRSQFKKPKTPEEELQEKIEHDLSDLIMRARDADADDISLTRSIMSKYNITKKPQ